MELTEPIDSINKQLVDHFGTDTITGLAMWRVVFSEDQFEKRLGTYDDFTPSDIYLRTVTEVREVPKYRQWIKERYVLERLVLIPDVNVSELPTQKQSYEPLFTFENAFNGEYLPPKFEAAKLVIDTLYAAIGKKSMIKYLDMLKEGTPEAKEARINKLQEELFGDESNLLGRTITGEAVAYTGPIKES